MYTVEKTYYPLKKSDIHPLKFSKDIQLEPKRMVMDIENDKLERLAMPSKPYKKSAEFLSRILYKTNDGFIYDGAHGDYSDPLQYPIYNESNFLITDYLFMRQFAREPPYFLHSSENCRLDLSNIIPYEYLKNSEEVPLPTSDEENMKRIARVDAKLIERENWGKNLKSYEAMREGAMTEMDGVYANDHIELRHAKIMFRSIRDLEIRVVELMYKRMQEIECFQDTVNRYETMTKELMYDKREEWIRYNMELEKSGQETVTFAQFSEQLKGRQKLQNNLYYKTDYFSSKENLYCDGCTISHIKGKPFTKKVDPAENYVDGLSIRRWIGNKETSIIYTTSNPWYPTKHTPFGATGIVMASWDRMFELKQLLTRWRGPLSAVFICKSEFEKQAISYIEKHFFPNRLSIILYVMKSEHPHYANFPINYLRNLAIVNIQTTHFMVLDMDLRMSMNTYDEIERIPKYIIESERSAVILPIFFFNNTSVLRRCISVENCAVVSNWYQPENKADLAACMHTRNCYSNKHLIRTHMYVMPEWYITRETSVVSRIRCFITDFMEPYFMVKYTPRLPLFHEGFINYGYNKVQYFENIRQMGFVFYMLNHAFAMDFPHPETEFRKTYSNMIHSTVDNPMKALYNELQGKFSADYAHVRNSRVCYLRQTSYYEPIYS